MKRWYLIAKQQYSENTPEYGHGDYPAQIQYFAAVVEADTLRKAQFKCKKLFPHIVFGGMFSPRLIEEDVKMFESLGLTKKADKRLSPKAQERHNSVLNDMVSFANG